MRASQLLFQTLRTSPGDDRLPGQQLLMRGSFVRPLWPHAITLLPLGVRTRRRLEAVALAAFDQTHSQEIQISGDSIATESMGVEPGSASDLAEDPSLAALLASVRGIVQSYRQLPVWLHQIGPARGDRAAMSREEWVANLFGLHTDTAETHTAKDLQLAMARHLLEHCDLATTPALANVSAAGHPLAHALIAPSNGGDLTAVCCPCCHYAAYQPVARCTRAAPAAEPQLPVEEIATPDCKTIADLARFLDVPASGTAKAVFLAAGPERRFVLALVRGDTDLDEAKLRRILGVDVLVPATENEIRRAGVEPGYGSPVGVSGVAVVIDDLVAATPNLVAGANRPGTHLRNVNAGRDYRPTTTADIALVQAGCACPECGESLELQRVAEIARVTIADGNSEALRTNLTYLDREGVSLPVVVTHTRIWLDRLMGALAESHRDEKGLIWPPAAAPFQVYLMSAGKLLPGISAAADRLYETLTAAGLDVLYDDRDERAGVKFNDADLLGIPIRVVLGERGLQEGVAEVKLRWRNEVEKIALGALPAYVNKVFSADAG